MGVYQMTASRIFLIIVVGIVFCQAKNFLVETEDRADTGSYLDLIEDEGYAEGFPMQNVADYSSNSFVLNSCLEDEYNKKIRQYKLWDFCKTAPNDWCKKCKKRRKCCRFGIDGIDDEHLIPNMKEHGVPCLLEVER